jgi:Arc/MetJ-type ribon-helix-helix transcriptional regulator
MVLSVNLPPHVRTWIERQVAEGRFPTEDAVITSAVEQAMESTYRWEEDEELLASIAEADRGEVFEWTPELRAEIRRQSEENSRRGHRVRDDTKY